MEKIRIDNRAYSVREYSFGRMGRWLEAIGGCVELLERIPRLVYCIAFFAGGYFLS
ncbi:MAG: hypothetical protein KAR06_05815 [Deltaproteobacteria bacterium]|nr:hypothetical protein [Deltaproteobacteria bacterium]